MITRINYLKELPDGTSFVRVVERAADVAWKLDKAKENGLATIQVTRAVTRETLVIPVSLVGPVEDRR